jgi:hypothetical protein
MASESDPKGRALSEAFSWVGRVVAVAVEMVLPGVAGSWLDRVWGTSFLALVGFGVGLAMGVTHLIVMVQASDRSKSDSRSDDK